MTSIEVDGRFKRHGSKRRIARFSFQVAEGVVLGFLDFIATRKRISVPLLATLAVMLMLVSCAPASLSQTARSGSATASTATTTIATTATATPPGAAIVVATVVKTVSPAITPGPSATLAPSPALAFSPTAPIPSPTPLIPPSPSTGQNVGYLAGHATIGPLTPVERAGEPPPTPSPAVCTARALEIDAADGVTEVTSFNLDGACNYRVALPPGSYVVRLKQRQVIGGSKDLPKNVTIRQGETVTVDIDIDTGIR